MRRVRRLLVQIAAVVVVLAVPLGGYVLLPWPIPAAASFEVVAHRGVHQTFPLAGLGNETCTARIIHPPAHEYIENTMPSIREAFARGATMVEIDIHRTADDHLVVFHDWTLDCRTNGTGVTNQQTLAYLKRLDVGHGYTADDGETFPLRGKGVGMMPTLPEVLAAFPGERFVIDNKDGGGETADLFGDYLATLPAEQRARLVYWGAQWSTRLPEEAPEVGNYIFGPMERRVCLRDYFLMLVTGALPAPCREDIIGIPFPLLGSLPGWPHLILARAHQAGARVFVADVDTPEQLAALEGLPIDGIQTNCIEVIGPLVAEWRKSGA